MKKIVLILLLAGVQAKSSVVENIELSCGLSDYIYDYINTTAGEAPKSNFAMPTQIGHGRHFRIYNDNSWILTLEFLSHEEIEKDKTCIIAKGELETQPFALELLKKLPWVGPDIAPKPAKPEPKKESKEDYLKET